MIGVVGGIVAAAIIAAFGDEITDYFKKTLREARQAVQEVIYNSRAFLQETEKKVKVIIQHYYRKNGANYIYQSTRLFDAEDVPSDILERVKREGELEVTGELEV